MAVVANTMASAQILNDVKNQATSEVTARTQDATEKGAQKFGESLKNATFGIRANGMINTSSLGNLSDIKDLKESGFNIGFSARVELGSNFFVNPELYYTHIGKSQIDLPILFGYSIVPDRIAIVAGPALMYSFSKDSLKHLQNTAIQGATTGIDYKGLAAMFKFGYQAGIQVFFGNFLVSAKYDGALSEQVVNLVNQGTGQKFEEKVKSNFVSLGIGYNFGSKD